MRLQIAIAVLLLVQQCVAPPVIQTKEAEETENKVDVEIDSGGDNETEIEYRRYLMEVVHVLEKDTEFRKKMDSVNNEELRTGAIAHELEKVDPTIRSKLDELKRIELERLRHLAKLKSEMENNSDANSLDDVHHVDHRNPDGFQVEDLKKLIIKTTDDLAEADRKRREKFKEYEMEKKFEEDQKIKKMEEEERKKYLEEMEKIKEKHKKHEPVHHPGSKQQLEEVWEEQDHMNDQEFDPKTFFHMHDLDDNNFWDEVEVKAVVLNEVRKIHTDGDSDPHERAEELERMREHIFREADINKDGLIHYSEFMKYTNHPDFQKDEGWDSLEQQEVYSQPEYITYEHMRQAELERLAAGRSQPPHGNIHDPNQMHYQGQPPIQQQQFHGQPPMQQQQFYGQPPIQQQQYQSQPPIQQQQYQGQPPIQQQNYQGQPPIQQQQFQGQPQVQHYEGQVPPQNIPAHQQLPVQQQQYPNSVPVQQNIHQQVNGQQPNIPISNQVPIEANGIQGHPPQQQINPNGIHPAVQLGSNEINRASPDVVKT